MHTDFTSYCSKSEPYPKMLPNLECSAACTDLRSFHSLQVEMSCCSYFTAKTT